MQAQPAPEIKVEIGHEAVAARKRGRIRAAVVAALACAAGLVIGFGASSMHTQHRADQACIEDVRELVDPVRRSAQDADAIGLAVEAAMKSLRGGAYPDALAKELAKTEVAFP